jgi:tetratricopeptide (TPR) repeat protein
MGEDRMTHQSSLKTTDVTSLLVQANELRHKQEYEEALALYLEILKRSEGSVGLFSVVAFCHLALSNFEEAITWLEKAIGLAPNDDQLHATLAEYCSIGTLNYEQAASEYRKAIELNPNSLRALVGAAALYGVPEEVVTLGETINWLERASELEPDDPNYHFRLGKFYREAGRPLDGVQEWHKALLCTRPLDPGPIRVIKESVG